MTERSASGGFTLIELAIVLAIVALVAALAIPNMARFIGRYRLNQAAERMSMHVSLCRSLAISGNTEFAIQFTERDEAFDTGEWRLNKGAYRVVKGNLPSGSTSWEAVDLGPGNGTGVIDLDQGPGAVEGISLKSWSTLQGTPEMPDAMVFGPAGHMTNNAADFQDTYIRIVFANRSGRPTAESRAILVDRGGNVSVVQPD